MLPFSNPSRATSCSTRPSTFTIGIDGTNLEATAAMRSIVRREGGETYEEYLKGLAAEAGVETPTREQLAQMDRKRKKRMSNEE